MSKHIIELNEDCKIVQQMCVTEHGNAYTDGCYSCDLEELNFDYINEHYGELQDDAYKHGYKDGRNIGIKDGMCDAWDAAKKLFSSMADSDIDKAFPIEWNNGGFNALMNLQPQEVIEKLKAYEEKQKADDKIEVGDELTAYSGVKCIATFADYENDIFYVMFSDGSSGKRDVKTLKKTGRHFDIQKILDEMREVTT